MCICTASVYVYLRLVVCICILWVYMYIYTIACCFFLIPYFMLKLWFTLFIEWIDGWACFWRLLVSTDLLVYSAYLVWHSTALYLRPFNPYFSYCCFLSKLFCCVVRCHGYISPDIWAFWILCLHICFEHDMCCFPLLPFLW